MTAALQNIGAAGLGTALLAGCAMAPPPPPVTAYAAHSCAAAPDLATAIDLTPERRKRVYTISTPVDASTPCFRDEARATPYVLYALPIESAGKMIEVGAQLEQARIFSPAVVILDEDGEEVRSFVPEQYLHRGAYFSVQFLPQPGERFVRVTADPARIGSSYDAIAIGTSTTYVATPYGGASWTSGIDQAVSRVFSYEGAIVAVVHSPEPEEQ